MTSIARIFSKFKKKYLFFFVILFPFEILSHYLRDGSSHWLQIDVQGIIDEVVGEVIMV